MFLRIICCFRWLCIANKQYYCYNKHKEASAYKDEANRDEFSHHSKNDRSNNDEKRLDETINTTNTPHHANWNIILVKCVKSCIHKRH